jgi:hypothetical protein
MPLSAQRPATATITAEADFVKEPGGTILGRLTKGTPVTTGPTRANAVEIRLEGWIAANALRADRRDGYDLAVSLTAGTTLRSAPGGGTALGTMRVGALFKRLESRGEWVKVERTAWIAQAVVGAAAAATPPGKTTTTPASSTADTTPGAQAPSSTTISVSGGATLANQPSGPPIATLEVPMAATVLERRDGWAKVQLEAWVREGSLGEGGRSGGPTAAEIRANPDRYIGQTVEWSLQVLAIQQADELRPELPLGQPYVLARGPLPETGFVYLVVSAKEAATFRAMEPLAKVQIRATIRAGRSRFLPTPVLTFVRRLD